VLLIEDQVPEAIASILLLDGDGARVHTAAAPNLPAAYSAAIDAAPIGPRAGSCGTAAYRRERVIVEDIETDPLWEDYRALARAHGLRACWSTPIVSRDGRVLGTFALYARAPHAPSEAEIELVDRATHVAGIAIERRDLDEQLRALSAHVESVREEERTGIAREIHDELGQALTALKMDIAWLERRAPSDDFRDKLHGMAEMTNDLVDVVRRISAELRPAVLDDVGLLAAIEWQAQEFERRTGTSCDVTSNLGDRALPRDLSTAVFRILQEALTNIARHAEATRVAIDLVEDGPRLRLTVNDNGKGIQKEAAHGPRSLGLLGMRERARHLGGTATVRGAPEGGTVVSLDVPFERGGDAQGGDRR
jgi:signal transduction histidine kinase